MKLTDSVTLQNVKERLGVGQNEELRESEKRRRYLEKFARIITPRRPTVRMSDRLPTAACNQEGDEPVIQMTTREFDQTATEFSEKTFDLIMQEALMVHEVGHVLYTDHDDFKTHLSRADMDYKPMFKRVWNTLEDGAIEKQLRHRFRVENEIEVLNRNLFEGDDFGHRVDEDTERFSVYQAVCLGLSDMAVYDSGKFAKVIDPDDETYTMASPGDRERVIDFVPVMQDAVQDVLSEPKSEGRNQRIWEFWTELRDLLDDSDVSGENESNLQNLISQDGSIGGGGGDDGDDSNAPDDGQSAPIQGKPDDTENDPGSDTDDALELDRDEVQDEVEQQVQMAAGAGGDGEEDEEDGSGGAGDDDSEEADQGDESGSGGAGDDGDEEGDEDDGSGDGSGGDLADELEEQYRDELAQEAAELDGGEATIGDAEEYLEIIQQANGAGGEFRGLTLDIPEPDGEFDRDRWQEANRNARRLERTFRNRLLREERDNIRRNQRRGKFDRGRMIAASRGRTDVFTREEEGDDKDYSCILVLDRSGSMYNDSMEAAENSAGALAMALEEVGVDVSILDLYHGQARLVKPFGRDTRSIRENLFHSNANGGTPLSDALHLARERVLEHDNPFMIVVTDGRPNNKDRYTRELDKANFPVLGVYLTSESAVENGNHKGDDAYFHRQIFVTDYDDLDTDLQRLAQEVMF